MKIMFFFKKFIFHINLLKRFKNIKKINLKSIFFFFYEKQVKPQYRQQLQGHYLSREMMQHRILRGSLHKTLI
jgi:hypothetical protein